MSFRGKRTDGHFTPGMTYFTPLGRPRAKRPRVVATDSIAVYGRIQGRPLLLTRADLEKLPMADHVPDIAAYASGETGRAVRFRAIIDLAKPRLGTLYVNFEDRRAQHRVSHFLAEIQELGWIGYSEDDDVRPGEQGGMFRLILPGIPIEYGRIGDLAGIEFADQAWV